jgi:hypothetical protein
LPGRRQGQKRDESEAKGCSSFKHTPTSFRSRGTNSVRETYLQLTVGLGWRFGRGPAEPRPSGLPGVRR